MTAGRRASARLLEMKEQMATTLTQRLYEDRPYLMERYGPRGRFHTEQDMQYNIEHLAPAVGLGDPSMFAGYVTWLDDLLRARDVPTAEVVRTLELILDLCRELLAGDEAAAVEPCVKAGLAVLERVS